MRLLIVDDEKPILSAMRSYFETQGFGVDCTTERAEAEVMIAKLEYGCVILDLKLTPQNDTDGLDLVRVCRERRPETRIIVLTAYGTPSVEAEARARGADAFVKKPQSLTDLARLVNRLTGTTATSPGARSEVMAPPFERIREDGSTRLATEKS